MRLTETGRIGCYDSGESQTQPSRGQHNVVVASTAAVAAAAGNGQINSTAGNGLEQRESRDGDLLSHAASALRRLHFKSAGGSRSCRSVPKVVVMGSSTASETTINTSTDSANTMLTMVTTTDGEQPDDSFDLIDVPSEMSPPPTATGPSAQYRGIGATGNVTCAATANLVVLVVNGNNGSTSTATLATAAAVAVAATTTNTVTTTATTTTTTTTSTSTITIATTITTATAATTTTTTTTTTTNNNNNNNINGNVNVTMNTNRKDTSVAAPTIAVSNGYIATDPLLTGKKNSDTEKDFHENVTSSTRRASSGDNGSDSANLYHSPRLQSNGLCAPPQTPLLGSHQETRFTFSGRTPPLPDLRAAEFFSTPVRGSVDAGQPDHGQANSISTLLAAGKEKSEKMPTDAETKQHHSHSCHRKPSVNVTMNPLDISLIGNQTATCNGQSTAACQRSRGRTAGGTGAGSKRSTQATIVVQQPSLSLDAPAATILLHPDTDAKRREENMRQLLDVANTLTLQEIHDFEMRYGSPHHSRSQSVKTPGSRSSGRPNYLCLPQQRSRVASMPNTGVEEEYYRLRHFSITGKGVVNRGDSLKSRRSRSNNSVASSNSSTEHLTASYPGSARNSAAGSLASSRESSASQGPAPYRVLMLGAPAVGKSSLVSQFMTSEHLHAYDTSIDDESGEKTVSVLLAGEESELTFIDHSCAEMTPENCIATYEPHAYCVVYSTTDRASVRVAEEVLQTLWRSDHVSARAVILVGNKVDLVRSRLVSTEEGKSMATSYDCKFIETSVGINHNVDELLVGLLTQIRLKLENPERTRDLFRKRSRKNRSKSPLGSCSENNSPKKYRGSRTSTSLKVRNLLGKVWARDSKSKSCENLHVL